MSLNPDTLDTSCNDDGFNWCEATSSYGLGDYGTPGAANDLCMVSVAEVWFSKSSANQIGVMNPDGSGLRYLSGMRAPQDVVLDLTNEQVYFTEWPGSYNVRRMDMDGSNLTTIYAGRGNQGIAIDPDAGRMWWGEYYSGLYAGSMDGSAPATLIVSSAQLRAAVGISTINGVGGGVEYDAARDKIYFFTRDNYTASASAGRYIWEVDPDGTNLAPLFRLQESNCMSFEEVEGYLYFQDGSAVASMWRMDPTNPSGTLEYLFDLADNSACSGVAMDPWAQRIYYQTNAYRMWVSDLDGANATALFSGIAGGSLALHFSE